MKNDVGYLIKRINDKLAVRADAELKQYHLTMSQGRVFQYLSSRGGQATQKEIETFLGVAHPTVVGLVSRMEQSGYVTCWPCEDGRNKNVKLTVQAEALDTEPAGKRANAFIPPFSRGARAAAKASDHRCGTFSVKADSRLAFLSLLYVACYTRI